MFFYVQLNLEISENETRKDFSKKERIDYAKRLRAIEELKAKEISMALINCPECGKEKVSHTALVCPKCGFAIREHFLNIEKIFRDLNIKKHKCRMLYSLTDFYKQMDFNELEIVKKYFRLVFLVGILIISLSF